MKKFTTAGLSLKIFYSGALLLHGKEEKIKPTKYISTNSKEVEIINGIPNVISILVVVFY